MKDPLKQTQKAMKCYLMILLCCLPLLGNAQAVETKKVTINMESGTLVQFFEQIRKQTGLDFIMSSEAQPSGSRKVTVHVTNQPVGKVLDQVLGQLGYTYGIRNGFITLKVKKGKMTGQVLDKNGEPIIGAVIRVNGETKPGAITDVDGKFSIEVPNSHSDITVSSIGYENTHFKAVLNKLVRIILKEDEHRLDELVVVGYGTQKKSALTSSIEVVKGEDLIKVPTPNLDEALKGQVAGLSVMSSTGDPGSPKEASMRIRAVTGANASPLLVIDGVPRFSEYTSDGEQRLSDLNPDDIESISVLKDAAAAAVYGVRAANGVLLIKTKRAKGDSKVRVNYRGEYDIQKSTHLPHFLNSYEFAKLYNKAVEGQPNVHPYTDEELEMLRTQSNPDEYANSNMLDYLKSHGYSTTHSLNISGGNQFLRYYFSGAYTKTMGLYSGVGNDRFNYAARMDATLLKGLTFSIDFSGVRSSNKNTSYATIDQAYSYSAVQPLVLSNGELASINGSNPLTSVYGIGGYTKNTIKMNTITAKLNWELPWIKGLSVYVRTTMDNNNSINKRFDKPVALYMYDTKKDEIVVDPNTIYPKAKISLYQMDRFVDNMLLEAGINYDQTFDQKHHVTALLVANYQDYKNKSMDGTNSDLPGVYPEVLGSSTTATLHGAESEVQRASLVGRATYSYSDRYFTEFNFREDGSAKFHPDHRWAFFPSFSASWILSRESWFRNWKQKVLSNVKFRASTGLLGRDGGISDYSYLLRYIYSSNNGYNLGGTHTPGVVVATGNYPNKDLEWEKSRDYNLAIDLGFWNNRFGLTFEYYWRYRTNMLQSAPSYLYPYSTGTNGSVPYMNFGKVKAWGYDLTITHRNGIRDFHYDAQFILSLGRDKILDYGDESAELENLRYKGHSTGTIWLYEALGLFQSQEEIDNYELNQDQSRKGKNLTIKPGDIKYKDQNGDGVLDRYDLVAYKSGAYPDFTGSLKLGFNWKGLFFNMMLQGVAGYKQYISESYTLENGSIVKYQDYHLTDCWTPDHPNAEYPRVKMATSADNNRKSSSFWLRDNSFIRLRSLNIGYQVPMRYLQHLGITSLSLTLSGGNLHTWSKLKHMDPESHLGYPIQRSYGASFHIGF